MEITNRGSRETRRGVYGTGLKKPPGESDKCSIMAHAIQICGDHTQRTQDTDN